MLTRLLAGYSRRARRLTAAALAGAVLLAAPAAQAFTDVDAGIYTVADKDGKPTNIAYRFYLQNGKWLAEERAADGGWVAFKCEKNCEIKPLPEVEMVRLLTSKVYEDIKPNCVGNGNFAVCRYLLKKDPSAPRYMMMVQTDQGIALVHLIWTAQL
jgi:hypothetical protein